MGELSYDDGTFNLFDSLASGTSGGIYFQTTTNQSFVWLGTRSETSYKTQLRSVILSRLECVLL